MTKNGSFFALVLAVVTTSKWEVARFYDLDRHEGDQQNHGSVERGWRISILGGPERESPELSQSGRRHYGGSVGFCQQVWRHLRCELLDCEGWKWDVHDLSFRDFDLSTSQIKRGVPPPGLDFTIWNRRWELCEPNQVWSMCCRKIWTGFTHPCSRFIVWRLLNHTYYCNSWGALWGVNPTCPVCLVIGEIPIHLFFECRWTKNRWAKIQATTKGTRFDHSHCFTLLEMASTTIAWQRQCPALFFIFVETIHLVWCEQNGVVLGRDSSKAPNALIWCRVGDRLDALLCKLKNQKIQRIVNEDHRRISYLIPVSLLLLVIL